MAAPMTVPSIEEILIDFGVNSLKPLQREIIENIIETRDCIAVLPTGYGKSLPFQAYALAQKRLASTCEDPCERPKVLVCSPLIGLMEDQVNKLSKIKDLRAGYKGQSAEKDDSIKIGQIDLIYASPEALVGDQEWKRAIQTLNITLIVVDEFHTIYTWGLQTDSRKEAFRSCFASIGELRSFFPKAPLLALSATCPLKIRKKITKCLNLIDATEISFSPNKSNIKLIVAKVPNSVEMAFTWVVDGLSSLKTEFQNVLYIATQLKMHPLFISTLSQNAKNIVSLLLCFILNLLKGVKMT